MFYKNNSAPLNWLETIHMAREYKFSFRMILHDVNGFYAHAII